MTKDGKDLERLVALIEASLTPEARVRHNVELPILNSPTGKTTQCDVVIYTGPKHREIITIVEVQDRNERVKPNDFRGWKLKLEEVGAQRLICVSRLDFPESIKEQAVLAGHSVILINIKEATPESLPLNFLQFEYEHRDFQVTSLDLVQPTISRKEARAAGILEAALGKESTTANEPCWLIGGYGPVSLFILCRDFYNPPNGKTVGHGAIKFENDASPSLHILIDNIPLKVGLECEFQWTQEITRQPVSVFTYEQDAEGVLVWVAEVQHESPKGSVLLRLPLVQDGDHYILRSLYAKLPSGVDFTLELGRRG